MLQGTLTRRRLLHRAGAMAVGTSALGGVLAACGGGDGNGLTTAAEGIPSTPGRPGGVLGMAVSGEPATLDPHVTTLDVFNHGIRTTVFDSLTHVNDDLEIVPGMAHRWEVSGDGRAVTFLLRDGMRFHDGSPVTAEDVAFTVDRIKREEVGSPFAPQVATVRRVEAVDPLTARFLLTAPTPALPAYLLLVQIVSPRSIDQITKEPIGSGPFSFAEFVPGDRVRLRKFDGYYVQDRPLLDEIVLRTTPDAQARITALQGGRVQLLDGLAPKDVAPIDSGADTTVIQSPPIVKYEMFQFNNEGPPFDDQRVRQAISYLFNRQAYVDEIWQGLARPSVNPMVKEMAAFLPGSNERYPHDPERASALLEEAGFTSSSPLRIEITGPAGFPTLSNAALLLQDQLREIGHDAEVEELEIAAWIDKVATKGTYQATTDVYDTVPTDPGGMFNSDNLAPAFNLNRYDPPGYARQVKDAATETDPQRRIELYQKLQERLLEDMPMATIAHTPLLLGASTQVRGFSTGPSGLYVYTDTTVR